MPVKFSERAASALQEIRTKEIEASHMSSEAALRVVVVGGGCSGFTYKMGFDENITERDRVEDVGGVRVVVDDKSHMYLEGVEIDYHDGLMGKGFVFNNPNASGTCGCGSSFSI